MNVCDSTMGYKNVMQYDSNPAKLDFPTLNGEQSGWEENSELIVEDPDSMSHKDPH